MRKVRQHRTAPIVVGIVVGALALVGLAVPPWVLPPIESVETGPAAIEMVQFNDGDRERPYNSLPEPLPAAEDQDSPRAGDVYQNLQVLGDLSEAEFSRLMLAITEWVSPEAGCGYCHSLEEGFASDALYTKTVARNMLQMVRSVNSNWGDHVAPSGVTCYTCHRGENVPPWTWYEQIESSSDQFLGKSRPWHLEAGTIREFFPDVPYNKYLLEEHSSANIQSRDPLVSNAGRAEVSSEQDAENLYLFMMQMANSMGVNCTYCHNSRAFYDWSQSTPYRWIAYWGIRMARQINTDYIQPLASVFPEERKGPLGDPAKVHCGTCHLGNPKPLGGYNLTQHYLAGLTENGEAPDVSRKDAVIAVEAMPIAQTGPDLDAEQPSEPTAAPVSEDAIDQTESSRGGQTGEARGGSTADDAPVGDAVTPVPPAEAESAKPPQGGQRRDSDAPSQPGTADAPSMGQPPSNPPLEGEDATGNVPNEAPEPGGTGTDAPLPRESETDAPVVEEAEEPAEPRSEPATPQEEASPEPPENSGSSSGSGGDGTGQ